MGKNMSGKCYKCDYRGTVPGDAHSQCRHPDRFNINVKGDPHGIKSGWFFFPFNFDPAWLIYCDGFKSKEEG